ncbi:MAG: O-antigen ligase family protein, partial [Patescibacteria group bacterium]
ISGRKHGLWFLAAAILGLSLTFARGALIFAAIYLLWLLWQKRKQPLLFKTFLFSGATLFLLVVTAVAATSHLFDVERLDTGRSWWQRQTIKRPLVKNERLEYWRQATQAISERPLFGSGPGTFYLLSRRLHALPVSYAWYAHSYPLQTLAELGVIGALPVLALLLLAVFQARKVAGGHPLFAGLVLTLGYSLIEFNLDFLVIWLLFWGTCGLLLGKSTTSTPRATNGLVFEKVVAATVLLLVITQGLSEAFQRKGDARTSFFLAPQLEKRALELIRQKQAKSKSLTAQEENIVRFFHRRHPDVLFALAQTKLAAPQTELALELYRQAISLDPRSFQFYREYINFLLATSNKAEIGRALNMLWRSANKQGDLKEPLVDFQRQELVGAYSREVFAELGGIGLPEEGLPKILYLLGLKFLVDQPQLTRNLWLMARSLSPEWDYYHLELAALEYYAFSNLPAAKLVLANCQKYYYPARSCAFASQNIRALPPPGFHEQGVRAIPRPSQ